MCSNFLTIGNVIGEELRFKQLALDKTLKNGFIALFAKCTGLETAVSIRVDAARFFVIPSEVENGAAGKLGRRREGRRLSEREVSESNPTSTLRSARNDT